MSRTKKHTLNGKFNNGLIDVEDMPISMIHYWNRINFLTGYYKNMRKLKIESIIDNETNIELTNG